MILPTSCMEAAKGRDDGSVLLLQSVLLPCNIVLLGMMTVIEIPGVVQQKLRKGCCRSQCYLSTPNPMEPKPQEAIMDCGTHFYSSLISKLSSFLSCKEGGGEDLAKYKG